MQARNRCLSHETPVPTEKSQLDATQTMIESQYRPRVTESKLQKISIKYPLLYTQSSWPPKTTKGEH